METKKNLENSESINLELVVEEFLSEQKSQTKSINDLACAINSISDRLINIEEEFKKAKPISVATNTQPIEEMIKKSIYDIKMIILANEQKPNVKKFQLLLFPEQDARLFYKIVFGRWLLWLTVILLLTNLYKVTVHWIDRQKELQLQITENDRINRSWNYLYLKSDKGIKKLMDNAYNHSTEH